MDGFQRRKEQKKRNILEAALALFMEYGIQKVSIAEIAKKAKVSQVTIYNYFEGKHKLIHDVFIYYINKVTLEFEQIVASPLPFPQKVTEIIFNKGQVAKQIHNEFYQYIMIEYSHEGNYIEQIYATQVLPHFTALFQQGKEQGYVDPSLSNEAIMMYIKMMKEFFQQEEVYKNALPLAEEITRIFFYGLMGKREQV